MSFLKSSYKNNDTCTFFLSIFRYPYRSFQLIRYPYFFSFCHFVTTVLLILFLMAILCYSYFFEHFFCYSYCFRRRLIYILLLLLFFCWTSPTSRSSYLFLYNSFDTITFFHVEVSHFVDTCTFFDIIPFLPILFFDIVISHFVVTHTFFYIIPLLPILFLCNFSITTLCNLFFSVNLSVVTRTFFFDDLINLLPILFLM